jgi:hypothetical protein
MSEHTIGSENSGKPAPEGFAQVLRKFDPSATILTSGNDGCGR